MAGELEGVTILLVDDDRDILAAMGAALSELGPTIITATDGNSAVTQVQSNSPDLVVLDQMLPKRSGFLVMEHIKRSTPPGQERPKVLMITGNPGSRHKIYAKSIGVDLYLNKPFRMEKLLNSVQELLAEKDESEPESEE